MSKNRQQPAKVEPTQEQPRSVPVYRQCPLCFHGSGGVGVAYHTRRITDLTSERYYKCGSCSHTWTATVKSEVVEVNHRVVELNER